MNTTTQAETPNEFTRNNHGDCFLEVRRGETLITSRPLPETKAVEVAHNYRGRTSGMPDESTTVFMANGLIKERWVGSLDGWLQEI